MSLIDTGGGGSFGIWAVNESRDAIIIIDGRTDGTIALARALRSKSEEIEYSEGGREYCVDMWGGVLALHLTVLLCHKCTHTHLRSDEHTRLSPNE